MATKKYTEKDIQLLSEIEHVHARSAVYLGNTKETGYPVPLFGETLDVRNISFVPAVMKLFSEVVDNASDELIQAKIRKPKIKIAADVANAVYEVEDNGRGVPIGKHETGRYTPEVVFTTLRSGRNFVDNKDAGVIGTNGMGVSLTAICSEKFEIEIVRDGKRYRQVFADATRDISPPKITSGPARTSGTKVAFKLKENIFSTVTLPAELVRNRAIEIAATNPGLTVEYNDEIFYFKNGFGQLVSQYYPRHAHMGDNKINFYIVFDSHNRAEEDVFTWVNSSLLYDGGICNTQFINALVYKITSHLERESKKKKVSIVRADILQGLTVLGNIKVSDPSYDSQAKTKLTGPNLRRDMDQIIEDSWSSFARANKVWFEAIIQRAIDRSNVAATKQVIKDQQKGKKIKVEGFMEAENSRRDQCQLLITEGKSAKSSIVQSRDPTTTAALPLTGKINNVYGASVAELLKMGKVTDLLNVIGLIPGKRAMRSELRYGRVCFATDADYDGDHITTLLINLFFQFWPELFDSKYPPFFFRMVAPNIVAQKGNSRIHFPNRTEYENKKDDYKGYEITYLKGLGTMIKEDWDLILMGKTDVFVPIVNDGELESAMRLMFGPDSDARKDWLQTPND